MSHEFIHRLAENIKEKDHRELVEKEHQLHRAKILGEKGPVLWKEVVQKLKEYVEQLKLDLGNPVLANDLVFNDNRGVNIININKTKLPCVNSQLQWTGQLITFTYSSQNPKCGARPQQQKSIKIEVRVDHEDNVYLDMDGKRLSVHELAEDIMEKLFTV